MYKGGGGGYGFKLFPMELKNALQQKKNSSKFIIISYTIMHESECYFFLHLLHQNSCLVFVKKNIALFSQVE